MKIHWKSTIVALTACWIAMWACVDGVSAQHSRRVPVTVALVDRMPVPDAHIVILRRPGMTPQDVILLPRIGASPRMLSHAVRAMILARQNGGDVPATGQTMRVRLRDNTTPGIIPWTTRVINDLRRAEPLPISGVGTVSAVQIWLPPQHT